MAGREIPIDTKAFFGGGVEIIKKGDELAVEKKPGGAEPKKPQKVEWLTDFGPDLKLEELKGDNNGNRSEAGRNLGKKKKVKKPNGVFVSMVDDEVAQKKGASEKVTDGNDNKEAEAAPLPESVLEKNKYEDGVELHYFNALRDNIEKRGQKIRDLKDSPERDGLIEQQKKDMKELDEIFAMAKKDFAAASATEKAKKTITRN